MARHTANLSALPVRQPRAALQARRLLVVLAVALLLAPLSAGALFAAVPALQVAVTDTLATTTPGTQLTYTIRVSNTGAAPLDNVRARVQLSPSVTFVSASDSPTFAGGKYEWAIATLPASSVAFRYVTVNVNSPLAPGTVLTTAVEVDQVTDVTANTASDTTTIEAPQVTLNPTSLSFDPQQVGTTSAPQTVTLTNSGNQPLTISDISTSANFAETNDCGVSLAIGATCTISVTFAPTAGGPLNGTLSVSDSASGSPHTATLTGTGTQPAVSLNPTPLAFGDQRVGTTSTPQTVTLTNSGSAPLKIASIAISGDFAQTNTCPISPATLAIGLSCTISVTFTPSAVGALSGQVTIVSDAPGSPHTVGLTGAGVQPGASLLPASLTYSDQLINTTSAAQQVTLTNNGSAPLTIASIATSGDFAHTTTCESTLAPAASCTIGVTFTPTVLGPRTGQLTVNTDAPGPARTVALNGNGLSPAVQIDPASLDFGGVDVGATSAARTVYITNTGNTGLTFNAIAVSGDFAVAGTTCALSPATLAPNASCTVSVTFTPTAIGTHTGQLTITDSAPGGSQNVNLSGVGLQSALTISPSPLDFGNRRLGTTSAPQQVTLTNTGNKALTINTLGIAPASDFSVDIAATTCAVSSQLAPNASCTVGVTFTPSATGARASTLTIGSDAPNNPHTVALNGVGTDPQAALSPTSLDFGNQQVNTSATQNVTLTNSGVGALTISGITISSDYTQTNNCTASLAAGASCTISVTFTPAAQQPRPGTLTVTSDATGSPHTVAITGVGIQPVVSLNPTSLDFGSLAVNTASAPQVITLTNTGSQPLALTSVGTSSGFSQTNNCPASPTTIAIGASCTISISFTPASVGPISGALTIGSNAPSSPHTLTLTGVGSGAVYASAPAPGTVTMSSLIGSSNTLSITVSNDGNQPLTVTGPSESVAAPFSLAPAGGYTAEPAATQALVVTCAPSGVGPFTQRLTYATNDPARPTVVYTVVCTGTAAPTPAFSSSPAPGSTLALGTAAVGGSANADIAISESGTAALTVGLGGGSLATAITGANAADFTIVAPASFPITLPDGAAAQQLTLRCQPSGAGSRVATLTLTTNDPGQPTVSYALSCTGQAVTPTAPKIAYLSLVMKAAAATVASRPDLVAAVSVSPKSVAAGQPVAVSVAVTNQGDAAASEFWVDLYINPTAAPTGPNQPWNTRCALTPCYGIAWYVAQSVAPGQTITLSSDAGSYYAKNTIWDGVFAPGTSDLYVYVDSWNPTVAEGAVAESDEANNRGELRGLSVTGASTTSAGRDAAALPERPARPAR